MFLMFIHVLVIEMMIKFSVLLLISLQFAGLNYSYFLSLKVFSFFQTET